MKTSMDVSDDIGAGEGGDDVGEGAFFLPPALRRDLEASVRGRASTSSRRWDKALW